jgi:prepilin-type N-terminal cleavage/methylation domain-containing protein
VNKRLHGFTLVELVMVIVILGILAAIAVPRFLNLTGDAAAAAREGTRGALNTAIQMVRSRWIAQGSPATVTLDAGTITMNAGGYPDVGGTAYDSGAECATLVGRLLGGVPPAAAANCTGVTVPLRTEFSGGACQVQACPTDFPTAIVLSATSAI